MSAESKPVVVSPCEKAMTAIAIAIKPKSAGINNRARMIALTMPIARTHIAVTVTQVRPLATLRAYDPGISAEVFNPQPADIGRGWKGGKPFSGVASTTAPHR